MTEYVTTNVRLSRAMHERLRRKALEENKSLAEIVRESLAEYLAVPEAARLAGRNPSVEDPIFRIGELMRAEDVIGDRPTDTAARHDYYLYGADLDELPELSDGGD